LKVPGHALLRVYQFIFYQNRQGMNYLHKSTGGGILAVCMLLAIILPDNLYGQEVRQLSVKKMKKNHFLYVIGGEGNSVFTGSTEGNYLQPERKFPAMHMDF
jgi:hypothetical protein